MLGVLVVATLLASCSSSTTIPSPTSPSSPGTVNIPVGGLPGLPSTLTTTGIHVVHPSGGPPYLADSAGQAVLLRGVDTNGLVQYPADYQEEIPPTKKDLVEMSALGFDFLRLAVSWSRIEPSPGHFDTAYLAKVTQVVRWAREEGIAVLLDMHQDNWAADTYPGHEDDGAPPWATLDGSTPCTPEISTTACSLAAFASFWANRPVDGKPLQSWYLGALLALGRAGGAMNRHSNVAGIELMNEPWPAGPQPFETSSLYPFYNRMIDGLRSAGVVVPLWFEPSIVRDLTENAVAEAKRFSNYANLVYAVHIYTGVFSPPFTAPVPEKTALASFAAAAKEASIFGTPWVDDEFGANASPTWDGWIAQQLALQNRYGVGSGFWLWKQHRGTWYRWALVNSNGSLRHSTKRAQLLSIPHVDAVPGRLLATSASPSRLTVTVDGPGGKAVLWGGTVVKRGGPTLVAAGKPVVEVDGRIAHSQCRQVRYASAAVDLSGCQVTFHVPAGRQSITLSTGS
ncbi:MAG: cellulase family glycosylhydrolase [Actinomycetota bacterium]|nr:cellulase family glycosylhydrolase [Actinomycetota bacterium]